MSSLYFLGIKKSTIKKTPPFKYVFDWRDKKNYQRVLSSLDQVERFSETESSINYSVNGKPLKLIFRNFPCSDVAVLQQVFVSGCYEPIVKEILKSDSLTDRLKILDAGSNVGYSCLYFKAFFPASDIIAVEPEPGNQKQLEKNIEVNGFLLKELIKGGIWNKSTNLEVKRDFRDNREAAFTVKETTADNGIQGFSFDQIIQKNGWQEVDLLKIDIEGGETVLFDTDEHADNILQRTKFLAIEIHDEFHMRQTIYHHLQRNRFRYFESGDLTFAIKENKHI